MQLRSRKALSLGTCSIVARAPLEHVSRDSAFLDLCCKEFSLLINSPAAASQPNAEEVANTLWALGTSEHVLAITLATMGTSKQYNSSAFSTASNALHTYVLSTFPDRTRSLCPYWRFPQDKLHRALRGHSGRAFALSNDAQVIRHPATAHKKFYLGCVGASTLIVNVSTFHRGMLHCVYQLRSRTNSRNYLGFADNRVTKPWAVYVQAHLKLRKSTYLRAL